MRLLLVVGSIVMWSAVASCPGAAFAQNGPPAGSPPAAQSFVLNVEQHAAHMREVEDLLLDKDQSTRLAALALAVKDADPAVRGLAISGYLTGFTSLTPEVVIGTGSPVGHEDAPQIAIAEIKWATDGRSFRGTVRPVCDLNSAVEGQIAGGRLSIRYDGVCLSPALFHKDQQPNTGRVSRQCSIVLAPNDADDTLQGDLHCIGLATVLKVTLAFGA